MNGDTGNLWDSLTIQNKQHMLLILSILSMFLIDGVFVNVLRATFFASKLRKIPSKNVVSMCAQCCFCEFAARNSQNKSDINHKITRHMKFSVFVLRRGILIFIKMKTIENDIVCTCMHSQCVFMYSGHCAGTDMF